MALFDLSIVVAAQGTPEETAQCLQSLLAQEGVARHRLEIIVAEAAPFQAYEHWSNKTTVQPVKFIEVRTGKSLPLLHGAGIAEATAPLIAITEGHCTFALDWAIKAIEAHQRSAASAIGGAVLPGRHLGTLNTALFLCDYAQFLLPLKPQQTSDLPGNNVVFKRACLSKPADFARDGFWKTFYCKLLEKENHQLAIEPAMVVYYNRRLALLEVVARRYHHGRCFGGMRAGMISASTRALYCVTGAALPGLLSWKLARRCHGKEQSFKQLIVVWPAVLLCLCMWSAGEWLGNLLGPGHSCELL
jgi:hypothetical protein